MAAERGAWLHDHLPGVDGAPTLMDMDEVERHDLRYAPPCHPERSNAGDAYTSLGGQNPVCFACFLHELDAFECAGYDNLGDLVASGDRWYKPQFHLSVDLANRIKCECPVCGAHDRFPPASIEICEDRLTCLDCIGAGHDTPTCIAPHRGYVHQYPAPDGPSLASRLRARIAAITRGIDRW
jgi:hypothetical protein